MADAGAPGRGVGPTLWTSTAAFAACFAVWTIFSIVGLGIKDELALSETQFGFLLGMPILVGSLSRMLLGIWSDRIGGRRLFAAVMLLAAAATFLLSYAESYAQILLAGLGIGISGGAFSVGAAYIFRIVPPDRQGEAIGIFSTGNVGAALTGIAAPFVMLSLGWQAVAQIWAAGLAVMGIVFLLLARAEPGRAARRAEDAIPLAQQLAILKNFRIWRFSLYYFFVFGGFIALVLWLPRYLMGAYGLDVRAAGVLTALVFAVPASLFRIYGSRLYDRYGARAILYMVFGLSTLCSFMLSYPPTTYIVEGVRGPVVFATAMGLTPFLFVIFVLGFVMSLGMAVVFRIVPHYYPRHVGAVGGLVGMVGASGGFALPVAFGILNDLTGIWTSSFLLLFVLALASLLWLHGAIHVMERRALSRGQADALPELPEMAGLGEPGLVVPPRAGLIADWRPEEPEFWEKTGWPIARRNLWISTYCLLLSFAVWMVWSVVVAQLPAAGFAFTTDELFWLAALPGLSGATLRIFYSFLVGIFGGRLWTTLSTASLLIPAFGIGYAVQDPDTPYLIFLTLALLCGLGGANFSSSVANISFFFPKAEKGRAMAVNTGLGNVGVSLMQLVVPVAVTMSLFGALGGEAQIASDGTRIWLQNAGFIWVPLIIIGTVAAWFGMNDIASAKSSFADQAGIFQRSHTWIMAWLYTGTFGTFIGMSAGFPLLAGLVFPEVDALRYAFIGPLVGALARAASGGLADRAGGARVTFWVFVAMIAAIIGMIWFLDARSFGGFMAMVLLLFLVSGIGNASTFQMVPGIMHIAVARAEPGLSADAARKQADREAAALTGFISAIAAYGAFFIPKAYGSSIDLTGTAEAALWGFALFYLSCAALTWVCYSGPRSLLRRLDADMPAPWASPSAVAQGS